MRLDLYSDDIGSVEYVSHMGSDLSVVNAARVSFGSRREELNEKDIKLIDYLMQHNHTSPFEHCTITMRFTVPLFVRSQHHRHRTWAYNEISRRYTSVDMQFYEPREFRTQHKSNRQASEDNLFDPLITFKDSHDFGHSGYAANVVKKHHVTCMNTYQAMLDAGICREQARGVLPQNLYTQYYGTTNLHNLLKFISLRSHEGAQWEIQRVAQACLTIAREHFPESIRAYEKKHMEL